MDFVNNNLISNCEIEIYFNLKIYMVNREVYLLSCGHGRMAIIQAGAVECGVDIDRMGLHVSHEVK